MYKYLQSPSLKPKILLPLLVGGKLFANFVNRGLGFGCGLLDGRRCRGEGGAAGGFCCEGQADEFVGVVLGKAVEFSAVECAADMEAAPGLKRQ